MRENFLKNLSFAIRYVMCFFCPYSTKSQVKCKTQTQIQSMLDKRTSDKRTHRISEPFFISQYQFPNFLHCKTNKHRISEPRISEPHRINEPFFISQRYPNSYLSERFKKNTQKNENCRKSRKVQ